MAAAVRLQVGTTVRYLEPRSGKLRIGRIERYVTRGANKGHAIVQAAASDGRRSTIHPDRLREVH